MKIIEQSHEIMSVTPDLTLNIEAAGRVCYKSENLTVPGSADSLILRLIKSGHHSVLEHGSISVKFITDRGVTHELVRHRLASFSQESTRYCNYSSGKFNHEITCIRPVSLGSNCLSVDEWLTAMEDAERHYLNLIETGCTPEQARTVLPNSLKSEIVMTANPREWRHVLTLRCSKQAHPQIRALMIPLLNELKSINSVLFDDIMPSI